MSGSKGCRGWQGTGLIADEGGLSIGFDSIEKACGFVVNAIGENKERAGNLMIS